MKGFEDKLNRLEEINSSIKDRDLPLEESIKLFEEGMKLSKELEKQLKQTEKKIEILINPPEAPKGEKPELELFTQED